SFRRRPAARRSAGSRGLPHMAFGRGGGTMNRHRSPVRTGILIAALAAAGLVGAAQPPAAAAGVESVIVQGASGAQAAAAVRAFGGTVRNNLGIVGGVAAAVPAASVAVLQAQGFSVAEDVDARLAAESFAPAAADVQ